MVGLIAQTNVLLSQATHIRAQRSLDLHVLPLVLVHLASAHVLIQKQMVQSSVHQLLQSQHHMSQDGHPHLIRC